jgi:DNA-binding CsgD family transcriptional regulator
MKNKRNKRALPDVTFTERQLEVLACWGEVAGEAAIAEVLEISTHSVHTHLRRARAKLKVNRTFDAYKYALQKGMLK